jgi:glutamine cyclotransferase
MPKNSVSDWSTTAGDNTDVGGVNIAEGCSPSGINNAIRTVMAQIADVPLRPQAWELIQTSTGSAAASAAITGLSAYRRIRVTGTIFAGTDNVELYVQTSTDNGSNYATTAGDYEWQYVRGSGTSATSTSTVAGTGISLTGTTAVGNATNEAVQVEFTLEDFNQARQMRFIGNGYSIVTDGSQLMATIGGRRTSTTARDAFRVIASSGTITHSLLVEGSRT